MSKTRTKRMLDFCFDGRRVFCEFFDNVAAVRDVFVVFWRRRRRWGRMYRDALAGAEGTFAWQISAVSRGAYLRLPHLLKR